MSDIFREVDEDIRREQMKKIWDRVGPYVLGLAVLIVAGTAGYRGWEYWQDRQAQASGDRFIAALQLSNDGKHDEAITALEAIAKDGSGRYPVLARFRVGTEKAKAGDKTGAVAEFDAITADPAISNDIKMLARLRAALLLVDTTNLADMEARIGDLATTGNVWRHSAREMLGLAAWRTGDYAAAKKYFDAIVNDQESSREIRQRSQLMLALVDAKLGTPPPAAAAVPPPATDTSTTTTDTSTTAPAPPPQ